MKDIMISLAKRNGIIVAVYALVMMALPVMPQYAMAGSVYLMFFLIFGLIWANGILVKHMSRLLALLLTSVITLIVGGGVVLITIQVQQAFGK